MLLRDLRFISAYNDRSSRPANYGRIKLRRHLNSASPSPQTKGRFFHVQ